jgi:predicted flap endonuclease-1-like 5' DNA nuclease
MLASILLDVSAAGFNQIVQQTGISTTVVWVGILILVVAIVATLMIRESRRPREEGPEPVQTRAASPAPPVHAVPADDLTIIEGIGPKIAAVLNAEGIASFEALANTGPDKLQEILDTQGLHLADPSSWPEQARLAADGDQDGLRSLQGTLKAGRAV